MSRVTPGRPKKSDWRRSTRTAVPGLVYTYYLDIDFQCKKAQYSPKTEQDPESGEHSGTQTLYLGTYSTEEFNLASEVIIAGKLAEWTEEHPACIIITVGEPYRHRRGS